MHEHSHIDQGITGHQGPSEHDGQVHLRQHIASANREREMLGGARSRRSGDSPVRGPKASASPPCSQRHPHAATPTEVTTAAAALSIQSRSRSTNASSPPATSRLPCGACGALPCGAAGGRKYGAG